MYIYVSEAMLEKSISAVLTKEQKDTMTLGQLEALQEKVAKYVENRDKWLTSLVAIAVEKAMEPTVEMEEEVKPKGKKGKKNQVLAEIID